MPRRTIDQPKAGDQAKAGGEAGRARRRPGGRRSLVWLAAAVVLLVALYGGYWFAASRVLAGAVEGWMADMDRQGRDVVATDIGYEGFPLWFRVVAGQTSVSDPRLGVLTASSLRATARPWGWWYRLEASADGLDLRATPANHPPIHATARRLVAAADRDALGRRAVLVDLDDLVADEPGIAGARSVRLRAAVPEGRGGPGTEAVATLELRDALLPIRMMRGLPVDLPHADLAVRLAPWRPDLATPMGLIAWQEAGGTLTIEHIRLLWGPMTLDAVGELQLDEALRPAGTVIVRAAGWQEMLDEAEAAGLVDERQARTARLALGFLSRPGTDGGPSAIEVPLRLENGQALLGPIPLARLPSLLDFVTGPSS